MRIIKIVGDGMNRARRTEVSAEDAVQYALDCAARNYEGELERMQARTDALSNIVGRLISTLIAERTLRTAEQVDEIIGSYDIQVRED